MAEAGGRRTTLALLIGLLLLSVLPFVQVGGHSFINCDDDLYLVDNLEVQQGFHPELLRWAFTATAAGNWHPLTWLSHALDWSLFGEQPGGHHLVNVLLHALTTLLLFLALRRMTGDALAAAFIAALFAVHPLRAESVAWASERKDTLSGLLWMLALLLYARYARERSTGRYLLVALAVALGLCAKSMLVTLPCVLLLLDLWPLCRSSEDRSDPQKTSGRWWTVRILEKVPLLLLAAGAALLTVRAQSGAGFVSGMSSLPLAERAANAALSATLYLGKMAWPFDLAIFYPHPAVVDAGHESSLLLKGGLAALFLLIVSGLALAQLRRRPYLLVGWLWYLGTLVPVIGLVQVGEQAMADRYTYIPSIGITLAAVFLVRDLTGNRPRAGRAAAICGLLLLAFWIPLCWRQTATWKDSRTVLTHALEVTEDNYFALNHLGLLNAEEGHLDRARRLYEEALTIHPSSPMAHNDLGVVHERLGRLEQAAAAFERARGLNPDLPEVQRNLGAVYRRLGRLDQAEAILKHALQLDPSSQIAHLNLAQLYSARQDSEQAKLHYQTALRIGPASADLLTALGLLYRAEGDEARARESFEKALELQPNHLGARRSLGRP